MYKCFTFKPEDYRLPYETLEKNLVRFSVAEQGENKVMTMMVRGRSEEFEGGGRWTTVAHLCSTL